MLHCVRHEHWILRIGDASVHQHSVSAKFHCNGSIGCRTDSRIYDEWYARDYFAENLNVRAVLDAQPASDRRAQRHDSRRARVEQSFCKHNVIRGIGKNCKAFLD